MRHVPNLKRKLISLSTIDLKGYEFNVESRVLKVCKVARVVLEG